METSKQHPPWCNLSLFLSLYTSLMPNWGYIEHSLLTDIEMQVCTLSQMLSPCLRDMLDVNTLFLVTCYVHCHLGNVCSTVFHCL